MMFYKKYQTSKKRASITIIWPIRKKTPLIDTLKDKYSEAKVKITKILKGNYASLSYRRIKAKLQELGILLAEKVILRLMKEIQPSATVRNRRKYSSY